MNRFQAIVLNLVKINNITIIDLKLDSKDNKQVILKSVALETNESLELNSIVLVGFKPTSLIVATEKINEKIISIENSFKGKIIQITHGEVLSQLFLETSFGLIETILLKNSVSNLSLFKDKILFCYVKPNEISILESKEKF